MWTWTCILIGTVDLDLDLYLDRLGLGGIIEYRLCLSDDVSTQKDQWGLYRLKPIKSGLVEKESRDMLVVNDAPQNPIIHRAVYM